MTDRDDPTCRYIRISDPSLIVTDKWQLWRSLSDEYHLIMSAARLIHNARNFYMFQDIEELPHMQRIACAKISPSSTHPYELN
jgi:hypothetical protein